jgi:DNA-binding MarR family transcriptional regulator
MIPTEPLSTDVVEALLKAILVLSRTANTVLEERASDVPGISLSRSKLQILRLLHRRRAQTLTELSRFLNITKPGASQIVGSMLHQRLLVRRPSANDGRQYELTLAVRGREVLNQIRRGQRHFVRSAARDLARGDVTQWTTALTQLTRALVAADRTHERFCLQCGAHADGSCVLTGGHATCPYLEAHEDADRA